MTIGKHNVKSWKIKLVKRHFLKKNRHLPNVIVILDIWVQFLQAALHMCSWKWMFLESKLNAPNKGRSPVNDQTKTSHEQFRFFLQPILKILNFIKQCDNVSLFLSEFTLTIYNSVLLKRYFTQRYASKHVYLNLIWL